MGPVESTRQTDAAHRQHKARNAWEPCDDVVLTDGVCTIRLVKRNAYGSKRYSVERYGSRMHDTLFETLQGAGALYRRIGGAGSVKRR